MSRKNLFSILKGITQEEIEKSVPNHLLDKVCHTYDERVHINKEDYTGSIIIIYGLAYVDILDRRIYDVLALYDEDDVVKEFLHHELTELAEKQKQKVKFNKLCSDLLSLRRTNKKMAEEISKVTLSQSVIEEILIDFDIYLANNLITKRTEIYGDGADKYIYATYSDSNSDIALINLVYEECQRRNIKNSSGRSGINMITFFLDIIADKNRYNPVIDMFKANYNNDESNLTKILDVLNLQSDFDKLLFKKWLIQTVAITHNQKNGNIQTAEGVLTLQGPQAAGKTTFFRKLALEDDWFVEGAELDTTSKDSKITVLSGWITELGELDATMKRSQPALKSFITRGLDRIRFPFGKRDTLIPRTTNLCATVNPEQFLKDSTGNRRYWVINVSKIDKDKLFEISKKDIQKMWGYIYYLYKTSNVSYRLSQRELDELNNRNLIYTEYLPFEQEVTSAFDFTIEEDKWVWYTPTRISAIYSNHSINAERVGKILSKLARLNSHIKFKRTNTERMYLLPPIDDYLRTEHYL